MNRKYFIDEFTTFDIFLNEFLKLVKDSRIKSFIPMSGLSWSENCNYAAKLYDTDQPNYLIFENNIVLIFDYNFFSMINIEITNFSDLSKSVKTAVKTSDKFDFDCYNETIIDYELNRFSDEYIIDPSSDEVRPNGGDYFKEIVFHLSNNKKLCICAQNGESDGYCDIWMENDNLKGIFHGNPHIAWWN